MRSSLSSLSVEKTPYDLASWALLLLLVLLVGLTFGDYGITWDEPVQNSYGRVIGRYYFFAFRGQYDPTAVQFENERDVYHYGGLFDTVAALINLVSPLGEYETRHLLNAIVGLIGIIGCWKVARLLGGPRVGFWAALLLATTPRYYGAMFNNPKDIPFAVGYIWSLYYILRVLPHLPQVPWGLSLKLGCAIGATLGVRVGGVLLLGYLALVLGGWLVIRLASQHFSIRVLRVSIPLLASFTSVALISWLIMLLFWPWAQVQPLKRPFQAVARFAHYAWSGLVLFKGSFIPATKLPRDYSIHWLLITLPEIFLVGLGVAALYGAVRLLLRRTCSSRTAKLRYRYLGEYVSRCICAGSKVGSL